MKTETAAKTKSEGEVPPPEGACRVAGGNTLDGRALVDRILDEAADGLAMFVASSERRSPAPEGAGPRAGRSPVASPPPPAGNDASGGSRALRELIARVLEELVLRSRTIEFPGRLAWLPPDPDCRKNAADPDSLLRHLESRFPPADLVAAGVAREVGGTLELAAPLTDPDALLFILRDETGAFDVMAAGGTLSGRPAPVAALRDRFTQEAVARNEGGLAGVFDPVDAAIFRAAGIAAAVLPDPGELPVADVDALADAYGLRPRGRSGGAAPSTLVVAAWSPAAWARGAPDSRQRQVLECYTAFAPVAHAHALDLDAVVVWSPERDATRIAYFASREGREQFAELLAESFAAEGEMWPPAEPQGPPKPPRPVPAPPAPPSHCEARRRLRDVSLPGQVLGDRVDAWIEYQQALDREVIDPIHDDADAAEDAAARAVGHLFATAVRDTLLRAADLQAASAGGGGPNRDAQVKEKTRDYFKSVAIALKAAEANLRCATSSNSPRPLTVRSRPARLITVADGPTRPPADSPGRSP